MFVTLKKVYDRNVVNKYRIYLLLGVVIFNIIDYVYIYICVQYPPAIRGGYVPSPPANPENPRIIYAVLKRLCMILYTLKYASKTHSKDNLTH